jgi:hypothetical protein
MTVQPLMSLIVTAGLLLAQGGYVRMAEDKGVTVYRKEGAHVIELAAEGDIPASPTRVRQVLLDYSHHPKWVKSLAESRVLSTETNSMLVYQRLDLPLIHDRDFTLDVTWGEEGNVLWTRFACANDRGPAERHGVVRVRVHEGGWRLEPTDGGRATHARYVLHLDLAGSLPGWMSRGRAAKDVPSLFEALRRQLR